MGVLFGCLLDLAHAQCGCSASTAVTSPAISIPGPPAWVVADTITNPSTLDGVCPREGCLNVRQCQHDLLIDVNVTFPYAPPPAAPLPVPAADVLFATIKFPLQWTGTQVHPNGTATLSSVFPLSLYTACTTSGDSEATFLIRWTGPEGAVIRLARRNRRGSDHGDPALAGEGNRDPARHSGSATVKCKK